MNKRNLKYLIAAYFVIGLVQLNFAGGTVSIGIDANSTYTYNGLKNVHNSTIWPIWSKIDIFNCTYVPTTAGSLYDFVQNVCATGGWENARYYLWYDPIACTDQDDAYTGNPNIATAQNCLNTSHPFFTQIKKMAAAGINPTIVFGYVPRTLSKNAGYITFPTNASSGSATWKFYVPNNAANGNFIFHFRYLFNSKVSGNLKLTITGPTNFNASGSWSGTVNFNSHVAWALPGDNTISPALPSFPEGAYSFKLESTSSTSFKNANAALNIDYLTPFLTTYTPHKYEAEYATITAPVVLGNAISGFSCGREGDFGHNTMTVDQTRYGVYQEYIRALFNQLISDNGIAKVQSWDFRFMEEANHTHVWDPFALDCDPIYSTGSLIVQNSAQNLGEYKNLFDYALKGMNEAIVTDHKGTRKDLQVGPFTDVNSTSWLPSILSFLGGTSTLETTQKRIQGNGVYISFDPYISPADKDVVTYINGQTNSVKSTFQSSSLSGKNLHLSLGEFGLTGGQTDDNGGMSNDGAAFFAAAFKTGLDLGYDFFNTWYWKTWGDESDPSSFLWDGKKTAAYRLVDFLSFTNNSTRLNAAVTKTGNYNVNAELDILCSKNNSTKQLYLMAYNYNYLKPSSGSEAYSITITNLAPNTNYRVEQNTISTAKNNFFPQWIKTASSIQNVNQYPFDVLSTPMAPNVLNLVTNLDNLWKSSRDGYAYADVPDVSMVKTDSNGKLIIGTFAADPNTVYFFNVGIPSITPILNLLLKH